ncbi:ABC transporter substrate-binding protein [Caproiciproducens sp. CPB-2]|uniref:ABC transporter substrate-binding protein n=1 Tax=Caproiciproducens sp. CPB-2 TaxID=3030017 RepID=UPI0023DB40CB|nr:ABC transporter substrate-binding protein [Caproiciproducens sp. CPB-2]MDF1493210.1 ABC transporter substrate-binding protein [Caproiciproducens sp. CPB-2]
MKNRFHYTIKRIMAGILAAALAASFTACSSGTAASSAASAAGSEAQSQGAAKNFKIGVIQYATHPSLDNCYTGFKAGLEEAGLKDGDNITIDFQNAQGDNANGDLIAKNMVSKKYDMMMGIATPAAMSAYSAAKSTDIPVVFTAVSDAVAAGIVKSNEKPEVNCTGSSDVLPLEQQIKMIRAFLPDAKKIGILYTTSEPNSVSQLAQFTELAPKYNFEVVDVGVTNASEVAAAAATAVSKGVDCINNFTDNNVVDNLSSVLQAAGKANIPVFGSEEEQVKNGCLASQSIDYVALGKETGKMAAKILKGEAKASETPVYMVKDCTPVYNKAVMDQLGLTLPAEYSGATAVTK